MRAEGGSSCGSLREVRDATQQVNLKNNAELY